MVIFLAQTLEPWWIYTCRQFAKVNGLETGYSFLTYPEYRRTGLDVENDALVEYASERQHPESLFIPKRNTYTTDDYSWLTDGLPIFRSTRGAEKGTYDIFFNAFVHLSRLEEWESEKSTHRVHSYSFRHPRKETALWKIPIVNLLFNDLEGRIKSKFAHVNFGERNVPVIEYSHDVDYIEKTIPLRIKQTSFHLFKAGRHLTRSRWLQAFSKIKQAVRFFSQGANYWCFEDWNTLEQLYSVKSVYYFYAKTQQPPKPGLRKWLIDPSYDLVQNNRLKAQCSELLARGHRIGIHGSYGSAEDESLFQREKCTLEEVIRCDITKSRQHWLNYREQNTPYIHSKTGIKEDSTVGFNDISGFRAGIASRYNPYDHRNQSPFDFEEIPLVMMDSHVYDYSDAAGSDNIDWLFRCMKDVKNFSVSIDWHQRGISPDYGWVDSYRQVLERHRKQIHQHEPQS